VYYFALPALFFINVAETTFTSEILPFIFSGIIPIFIVLGIYILIYFLFQFQKSTLYLLILSTIFGSVAFFGIPFITFAFPAEGERLATISTAFIAVVSVTVSLTALEMYKLKKSAKLAGIKNVAVRLSKNPLILSIILGSIISLVGIRIPDPISAPLHMLGSTTSTVAIFMLGVFLYGRKYTNIGEAFKLSLLRMIYLPIITFLTTIFFGVTGIESSVLILMHGTPVAISMIVLSERYNFYKETIASLILISTLSATVYLNLWLLLLGNY
jgi:predicted permease